MRQNGSWVQQRGVVETQGGMNFWPTTPPWGLRSLTLGLSYAQDITNPAAVTANIAGYAALDKGVFWRYQGGNQHRRMT